MLNQKYPYQLGYNLNILTHLNNPTTNCESLVDKDAILPNTLSRVTPLQQSTMCPCYVSVLPSLEKISDHALRETFFFFFIYNKELFISKVLFAVVVLLCEVWFWRDLECVPFSRFFIFFEIGQGE